MLCRLASTVLDLLAAQRTRPVFQINHNSFRDAYEARVEWHLVVVV